MLILVLQWYSYQRLTHNNLDESDDHYTLIPCHIIECIVCIEHVLQLLGITL